MALVISKTPQRLANGDNNGRHMAALRHSGDAVLKELLDFVRPLEDDPLSSSRIYCQLAEYLTGARRQHLVTAALRQATLIEKPAELAGMLLDLLPLLDSQLRTEMVEYLCANLDLLDEAYRDVICTALVEYLAEAQTPLALAMIAGLPDEDRYLPLAALARRLPEQQGEALLEEAEASIAALQTPMERANALIDLLAYAGPAHRHDLAEQVIETVRLCDNPVIQCDLLTALAEVDGLGGLDRRVVLDRLLATLEPIRSSYWGVRCLARVVQHFPPRQRRSLVLESLADALKLENATSKVRAIRALLPHLPSDFLPALGIAFRELDDPRLRAEGLIALLSRRDCPDRVGLIAEVINLLSRIPSTVARDRILADLVPVALGQCWSVVMSLADQAESSWCRVRIATALLEVANESIVAGLIRNIVPPGSDGASALHPGPDFDGFSAQLHRILSCVECDAERQDLSDTSPQQLLHQELGERIKVINTGLESLFLRTVELPMTCRGGVSRDGLVNELKYAMGHLDEFQRQLQKLQEVTALG